MPIQIASVGSDPARSDDTTNYTIKLKSGATQNETRYFNEIAEKHVNKQFNAIHATPGQISVQVTGVSFADMIKKVEALVDQANGSDEALESEIKAYNEKIKQK